MDEVVIKFVFTKERKLIEKFGTIFTYAGIYLSIAVMAALTVTFILIFSCNDGSIDGFAFFVGSLRF